MQKIFKPAVFMACLIPFIVITYQIFFNKLGAEPVKEVTHHTGNWTLRFILISLAMTPLRNITNSLVWTRYRRMFGLFAFFYASLHLLTYVGLDYRFNLNPIFDDVLNKKYIFIGFAAWFFMIPLTITSNQWMVKILKQNWKKLHRLSYLIGIFAVLHFIWLSKTIFFEPLVYLIILIILLVFRLNFLKLMFKKSPVN